MVTIGVAVAIPEPWATRLQDYRTALGDATATMIPTHITLIPPTEVEADSLADINDHLASVAGAVAPFEVHLRGTGTFRPVSPVVFVAVAQGISAFEQLALSVRAGPLAMDLDFPYHPHVTVAHHLADDVLDRAYRELGAFSAEFVAERFWLYVHDGVTGWQPTQSHALRG